VRRVVPPLLRANANFRGYFIGQSTSLLGIGVRPTLRIATIGALAGVLWLLPSPIRTMGDVPEEAAA
jgi:hypothetical protein